MRINELVARRYEPNAIVDVRDEVEPLIPAAQAGDEQARAKILLAMQSVLFRILRKHINEDYFEDWMQLASIGVLNAIDKFDPERGASFLSVSWWYVRTEINKELRKQTATDRAEMLTDDYEDFYTPPEVAPEVSVAELLDQLPERQSQILGLFYDAGWSASEIANRLGVTENWVFQALHHGRKRLKELREGQHGSVG